LQLETIVPLLHSKKLSLLKNYECTLSSPSLIKSIDEGQKVRALLKCYCLAQLAWHMFDYLFQFNTPYILFNLSFAPDFYHCPHLTSTLN
jgi:hypothetical protein